MRSQNMETLTLAENPSDTLTDTVLNRWEHDGVKSRHMDRNEIKHLAIYFLKMCREQELDYQTFDFCTLIDSNLTPLENRQQIIYELGEPQEQKEKEAFSQLNTKMQDDYGITLTKQFKPITELEQKNLELQEKNRKIATMLKKAEEEKHRLIQIQTQPKNIETLPPPPQPTEPPPPALVYTQEELLLILQHHKAKSSMAKIVCTKIFKAIKWVLI
jgi:hypothetical protein